MRLVDAARYFDRVVCQDAYSPATTFNAQLDLFDDSKRDGGTVARRVLSVAPSVVIPARGAVRVHSDVFIVGYGHEDSFDGSVVRQKYVCHRADELATVRTLDQAIRALAGTAAYGARLWVKDVKEVEVSSSLNAFFNLYFSNTESVTIGSIVTIAGRQHLVRNSFISSAGFLLCEADELPETARAAIVYTNAGDVYDSANDTWGAGAPINCFALWHRFKSGFEYLRASAEEFRPGDITVNVSKTNVAVAAPGDTFTMEGSTWRVVDVRDNGDNVWMLHARRV